MSQSSEPFDIGVVGAGIVGLGAAWAAARRGARVALFESSPRPSGGSVRNFGMIWPIGQPAGPRYQLAIASRDLWLQLATEAGVAIERCGSLHLAHHDDEWRTLEQFADQYRDADQSVRLLSPGETCHRSPVANPDGLRGSLHSGDECRVDPRQAIQAVAAYLQQHHAVDFHANTTVAEAGDGFVRTTAGTHVACEQVLVCSGADFHRLFPRTHQDAGLISCKLQMLRTRTPDPSFALGPHVASGLTLRHYESFAECPAQHEVRSRVAEQMPELDRWGIHVMVSQSLGGQLVLGDSHEYGDAIEPFEKSEIDQLILRELRKVVRLPTWDIEQRWSGVYAKLPGRPFLVTRPEGCRQVTVINGLGGAGMTLSLAVADRAVEGVLRREATVDII